MDRPNYKYISSRSAQDTTCSLVLPLQLLLLQLLSQLLLRRERLAAFECHEGSLVTLGLQDSLYHLFGHCYMAVEKDPILDDDILLDYRCNLLLDATELSGDSLWIEIGRAHV